MARVTATNRYTPIASPLSITSPACVEWNDVGDLASITKDGSNFISQINDKSGLGHHRTAAVGQRPIYDAASTIGVPSMVFDGVDDFSQSTYTLVQPWSMSMACRIKTLGAGASHDIVADGKNDLSGAIVINDPAGTGPLQINAGANAVIVAQTVAWAMTAKSYSVVTFVFSGGVVTTYIEDRVLGSGACGANAPGGVTLGTRGNGQASRSCNVEFTQLAVYSGALTLAQVRQLVRFFRGQA